MKKKFQIMVVAAISILISGCSSDQPDPEAAVKAYTYAWENQQYNELTDFLSLASQEEVSNGSVSFAEKYAEIHEQMDVSRIQVNYETTDINEEEMDWDEVSDLTYPVTVEIETLAGAITYDSEVQVVREIQTNEEGEEIDDWFVNWKPDHLFESFQSIDDKIVYQIVTPENRGQIYDRNGEPLAINGQFHRIGFQYEKIKDLETEAKQLATILGLEPDEVAELAVVYRDSNPDWLAPVMDVPLNDGRIEEIAEATIPGVVMERRPGREYRYAHLTAHLIGDLREVNAEDLEREDWPGYGAGKYIGRLGLETAYEEQLRGEVGFEVRVEDASGETRDVLMKTEPQDGEDLTLTIDVNIQQKLYDSIGDEAASGVVMDPVKGEVLALVSRPVFNPNEVYLGTKSPERTAWIEDERNVNLIRFNRTFSPGSVFKPLTAAIGLEEGVLDPNEVVHIDGEQWRADSSWGNYRVTRVNPGVSDVNLETAMKYSDNIYFAQKSLEIGAERMLDWAETFGFSEEFSFEYPLHDSQVANGGLDNEILLADTGYGQGEVQMNPVHLSSLYTMFVNEGTIVQPILFMDSDSRPWKEHVIEASTAETIFDTLLAVVNEPNGTAYRENSGHSRMLAGKTGTAEIKDAQGTEGDEIGWYTSVDATHQDLLVTLMVEGLGSSTVVDMANRFWAEMEE
ncbi:penicillin-binding transpeptidase domain-containing protein [Halalkalibacter okhensis]|uniref:serine-type D-Ala-D-Ala carboxypeptidase n=1 Tax=Halalkalibacter okhensis TaxID=333138 RepID=A0A0B0IH75_9BACI|nr:penicillin-binding transpeptidase domain-containing protein [Halalkalibacter okhensis]KHF40665.1 hypothetical protein LQ50_07630 [Halalkalibacter okhensis]